MRLQALIAEDEPQLAQHLQKMLHHLWPELEVVAIAPNGFEALHLIQTHQPQVVFLDIQMPGMTGLEVARQISGQHHVVFVTAYEAYALQAFEQAAVDYLLKPVDPTRLEATITRLKNSLSQTPPNLENLLETLAQLQGAKPRYTEWLKVEVRQEVRLVAVDEVDVFEADQKYTLAKNTQHEWLLKSTLKELEEMLDPNRFWRVHRGFLVRAQAIERLVPEMGFRFSLFLKGHQEAIPVSRSYAGRFKQM